VAPPTQTSVDVDDGTCTPACQAGYTCTQKSCALSNCYAVPFISEENCRSIGCGFVGGRQCVKK